MPRPKANPDPNEGRRSRLSLAKLASYDDVATDALVDNVRIFGVHHVSYCFSVQLLTFFIWYRPISGQIRARTGPSTFL